MCTGVRAAAHAIGLLAVCAVTLIPRDTVEPTPLTLLHVVDRNRTLGEPPFRPFLEAFVRGGHSSSAPWTWREESPEAFFGATLPAGLAAGMALCGLVYAGLVRLSSRWFSQ